MSSFHGKTRPDPPRIPQDLATKGYVDDVATHGHVSVVGVTLVDAVAATPNTEFICIFTRTGLANQTGNRRFSFPMAVVLNLMCVLVNTNTYDTAYTITNMVNEVDANQTVTIPSSTTGKFQDVTNSDSYDNQDDNTIRVDAELVGAGSASTTSISFRAVTTD